MQQISLPSLYRLRREPVATGPFPLVRRKEPESTRGRRRLLAGMLFGLLMSGTLVLLGYAARIAWDQNPDLRSTLSGSLP